MVKHKDKPKVERPIYEAPKVDKDGWFIHDPLHPEPIPNHPEYDPGYHDPDVVDPTPHSPDPERDPKNDGYQPSS